MKCCVCNKETNDIREIKSTLNNDIKSYCSTCLFHSLESYTDLVDFGWTYDMFNQTYQNKIINPTLAFNHKTIEQFNTDVQKNRDDEDGS